MNVCTRLRKYEGTKSQIILEMIAEKKRVEIKKNMSKVIKKNGLENTFKQFKNVEKKIKELKAQRDILSLNLKGMATEKNCGIKWNTYCKNFEPQENCDCDEVVKKRLQNAQDLWSLGKCKEARKIWDDIMTHYKLAGMK